MSELQIAGIAIVVLGAVPCYLLARYIENRKHYSLFAGWDPSRISDEDAYGKLLCKGLKGFSFVMGLCGILVFSALINGELSITSALVLPAVPPIRNPLARISAAAQIKSPMRWNPNIE